MFLLLLCFLRDNKESERLDMELNFCHFLGLYIDRITTFIPFVLS